MKYIISLTYIFSRYNTTAQPHSLPSEYLRICRQTYEQGRGVEFGKLLDDGNGLIVLQPNKGFSKDTNAWYKRVDGADRIGAMINCHKLR